VLSDYFGLPFEIRQFVGEWLGVPADLGLRIGARPDTGLLGQTATLGSATWQCHHKFEIVLGPLVLNRFTEFLPGAPGLAALHALVRQYTNDEWSWQLRLLLREVEVPGITLGQSAQLGWTSWLGGRHAIAGDVLIQEAVAAAAAQRHPAPAA
jgi:type VI secretion system protein ImpH